MVSVIFLVSAACCFGVKQAVFPQVRKQLPLLLYYNVAVMLLITLRSTPFWPICKCNMHM